MSIDLGQLLSDAEKRWAARSGGRTFNLGGLFSKGSPAEQLLIWSVLNQLIGSALAPEFLMLQRGVNQLLQATPLSPQELADMVVRNIVPRGDAETYAKQSGIAPSDFARLVESAGDAPGPQQLVEALRRRLIPEHGKGPGVVSFEQGIAETRLHDKYTDMMRELGTVPLPPADAVDAVVKSQISHDQGQALAYLSGISAQDFEILEATRGNPPSPTELVELFKRGLIPLEGTGPDQLSVQQGIAEGATKNKWWRLVAALGDYVPPPRTVTALVREGSITDDEAVVLFRKSGLSQDLAAAYLNSAHHQKTSTEKDLAKGDLLQMYEDRVISGAEAGQGLQLLGLSEHDVGWLLAWRDARRALKVLNSAISRIHTLYVNRRIDRTQVVNALNTLKVPSDQQELLLLDWDVERDTSVKVLTAAEIASAYYYGIISQDTAMSELESIGYSEVGAWILLSVRKHGPQPNPPAGVSVPSRG